MNKSPEFDMLKEPAEPEKTEEQRAREQDKREEERRRTEKGIKMIMHKQKWVSFRGVAGIEKKHTADAVEAH